MGAEDIGCVSSIDLAAIVLKSGDLPQGYSGMKPKDSAPAAFKDLPEAENVIDQRIKKGKRIIGGTTIFLYKTAAEIDRAYSAVVRGFGETQPRTIPNIGERSALASLDMNIKVQRSRSLSFQALMILFLSGVSTLSRSGLMIPKSSWPTPGSWTSGSSDGYQAV